MESLLDAVAEGKVNWKTVVENFYPDLKDALDKKMSLRRLQYMMR